MHVMLYNVPGACLAVLYNNVIMVCDNGMSALNGRILAHVPLNNLYV